LEALSVINKLRIDNINFNNYILDDTAKGSETAGVDFGIAASVAAIS
jgi:hypothetical protein